MEWVNWDGLSPDQYHPKTEDMPDFTIIRAFISRRSFAFPLTLRNCMRISAKKRQLSANDCKMKSPRKSKETESIAICLVELPR